MTDFKTLIDDPIFIKRVQYFLITLFTILILWDFLLALDCVDNNTISGVIQNTVDSGLFVLTYFWGAVCANVFFPCENKPKINGTIGTIILYAIALLIVLVDAEKTVDSMMSVDLYKHGLGMAIGFIIGLVFWRQQVAN